MSIFDEKGLGLVKFSDPDPRDYVMSAAVGALPEEVMIPIFKVHDQGKFNNCAAHALSTVIESVNKMTMGFNFYYGNRRYSIHKGEGLISRDMLKAAQKDGGLLWNDYPYEEEVPKAIERFESLFESKKEKASMLRIKAYYSLRTVADVKNALNKGLPILFGTMLFDSFANITKNNDVMPIPRPEAEAMRGGHMMVIRGYSDKKRCLRAVNSWGDEFGDHGEFWVPYELVTWSEQNNFPIPLFEGWAIELTDQPLPPKPETKDGWYKQDNKWRYSKDGKDVVNQWLKVNNKWYYLKDDGYMLTGWFWYDKDKQWYYLNPSGDMRVNSWLKLDGYWYYFDASGHMLKGIHTINGKKYFLNPGTQAGIPGGACIITDPSGAIV